MLSGQATHLMLFGGSRSGKTFLHVRNTVMRALKAPNSRHVALRFRFNAIKTSIGMDTFPKVMELAYPGVEYELSKSDWFARFPNGSELWFGGLDDKERTEKILGTEFVTLFLNECSQIGWPAVGVAMTRLAQRATQSIGGRPDVPLRPRVYYDCNPPLKSHWTYRLFVQKLDPETREGIASPENYVAMQINPESNLENLSEDYLATLQGMSARLQKRFLRGEFGEATPNALFDDSLIERWRVNDGKTPDFVRVVVAVDPSGSGDVDNADNDAIGIVCVGLGVDGNAYLLEDATVKAGPATWGGVACSLYERHDADVLVAEVNFGGEMVRQTIEIARKARGMRSLQYKPVTASRGKVVRAEPFSAMYEAGKVRHVGLYPELEDELCAMSTYGYTGTGSPNRADAVVWALAELFPGVMRKREDQTEKKEDRYTKGQRQPSSPWAL